MALNAQCPVCDAAVSLPRNVEVSEIIICPECNTRLVVESMQDDQVTLAQAPEVEEDWGE